MFNDLINKKELTVAAKDFLTLLEKYKVKHQSAKNVLARSRALIERAINGEIDTPMPKGFFPEEFWEDGDLFQYDDLGDAVANFSLLLKGAESIDRVKKVVHDIDKKAEDEEAELLKKLKE